MPPVGGTLHLPRRPEAAAEARRAVAELAGADSPLASDLRLLVTELVANRVRSAVGVNAAWLELTLLLSDDVVRVELNDVGPRWVFDISPFTYEPEDSTGWSIYLVDRLADRWGVSRAESSVSVWFELDRD